MQIRYTRFAANFLSRLKSRDVTVYHNLRGLIIQLSANPEIDNETKILKDFGSGRSVPLYVDDEWWIIYRVILEGSEEIFSVISIYDARNPPNTRL